MPAVTFYANETVYNFLKQVGNKSSFINDALMEALEQNTKQTDLEDLDKREKELEAEKTRIKQEQEEINQIFQEKEKEKTSLEKKKELWRETIRKNAKDYFDYEMSEDDLILFERMDVDIPTFLEKQKGIGREQVKHHDEEEPNGNR